MRSPAAFDVLGVDLGGPNRFAPIIHRERVEQRFRLVESIQAAASHAPGTNRAAHPRLYANGAFLFTALDAATGKVIERSLSASSRRRVPELPARDRGPCPARTRSAPDHGQRRHLQDADDPKVARSATEIACPLHPTASSWMNLVERFFA